MAASPEIQTRQAQPYAAIAASVTMQTLGSVLPRLWPETAQWLAAHALEHAGAPFIRYLRIDMAQSMEIEVGIPTSTLAVGDERVVCGEIPAGRYVVATHTGHYDGLLDAHAALQAWAAANDAVFAKDQDGDTELWTARVESYLTDPGSQPDPAQWQTRIEYKIRN